MTDLGSRRPHALRRHVDREAPVEFTVIAHVGDLMRLRVAPGEDLFSGIVAVEDLELEVGTAVLVDAVYEDGTEGVAADVIGVPALGTIEVRTRGEIAGKPTTVRVRRGRIQGGR